MRRGAMRRGAIVALALALACALRATPARSRALDVDDARWRLGTARATTTSDCDACETFMRAVEAKIEQGQFQGEMAAAIAEACAKATRGEASQMSVCVAAGEAGLRFATRYLENHPELGDAACKALEMCDGDEDAVADASGAMVTSDDDEARIRAAARGDASASDETCADCVMASRLLANELRANSTISFVVGEVDALCAALGAELAHQCDAVVEPYVPVLLDELASSLKNVCARLGVCPK
jgi:hypothetical protein